MTAITPVIVAADTATSSAGNTERSVILLGLFTLIGTITTAIITAWGNRIAREARDHAAEARTQASEANTQATEANDAVNHRHPDQPRLFDAVNAMQAQLGQFQSQFQSQLSNIDTRVTGIDNRITTLHQTQHMTHQEVLSQVSEVRQELRDHVEWEMHQKYWDGTERRKSQLPYDGANRRFTQEEPCSNPPPSTSAPSEPPST